MAKKTRTSIYSQVADNICELIISGEYSALDKLLTETELARQLGVNRLTVSRGYSLLCQRGIITQRRGHGSFVSSDAGKLLGLPPRRRLRNIAIVMQSKNLADVPAHGQSALLDMIFGVSRRFADLATHVCHVSLDNPNQVHRELVTRFDAFIIIDYAVINQRLIKLAQEENRPCVLLWPNLSKNNYPKGIPVVSYDREGAVQLGIEHLISNGYRNIGFVGNGQSSSNSIKIETFIAIMRKHKLPLQEQCMLTAKTNIGSAYKAMHEFLVNGGQLPQAFFVDTDYKAIEVMHVLHAHGVNVPEQVAICGFDDIADAASSVPALTTVHTPRQEVGYSAADLLLNWLPGAPVPENIVLPSKLVVRETTPSII